MPSSFVFVFPDCVCILPPSLALRPLSFLCFSMQLSMCARDKEKELSQLSGTQPSAPLISSVNAVEITAVEVKHVSHWGIKRERERERERERMDRKQIWGQIHVHSIVCKHLTHSFFFFFNVSRTSSSRYLLIRGLALERAVGGRNWWEGRVGRKTGVWKIESWETKKQTLCFFAVSLSLSVSLSAHIFCTSSYSLSSGCNCAAYLLET